MNGARVFNQWLAKRSNKPAKIRGPCCDVVNRLSDWCLVLCTFDQESLQVLGSLHNWSQIFAGCNDLNPSKRIGREKSLDLAENRRIIGLRFGNVIGEVLHSVLCKSRTFYHSQGAATAVSWYHKF